MVEQDIKGYNEQIMAASQRLEEEIGRDLVRIQILLHDKDLIEEFYSLIGLEELIFYDPYVIDSPTIKARLFADIHPRWPHPPQPPVSLNQWSLIPTIAWCHHVAEVQRNPLWNDRGMGDHCRGDPHFSP